MTTNRPKNERRTSLTHDDPAQHIANLEAQLKMAKEEIAELKDYLREMRLNWRELATVLSTLRFWQAEIETDTSEEERDFARQLMGEHFDEIEPLDCAEIDALCERLNALNL